MNNFDCNKCMHKNVCAYKDKYPVYKDLDKDDMFEVKLHCKEYREEKPLPRDFISAPYNSGWITSTGSQETECEAYKSYIEQAKNSNYIGDSPCSYCFKTSCPHSRVITCSNTGTSTEKLTD